MSLQKQIFLSITFLFSSVFSMAQVHSESVRSVSSDSTKVNYLSSNQIFLTDSIINYGKMFLNTPYRRGANGSTSFDCSGFSSFVYRNFGYDLKRSSAEQAGQFETVDKHNLKTGDLVFFSGSRRSKRVGHVGIVVSANNDGKFDFIHASVQNGVVISKSDEPYYLKRYIKAGRVINSNEILTLVRNPLIANNQLSQTNSSVIQSPMSVPVIQTKKVIPAEFHRVKKGETLSEIAHKYGLTIAELKRKNNIKGNKINPKQRLKVKDSETVLLAEAIQNPTINQAQSEENPTSNNVEIVKPDQDVVAVNPSNTPHTVTVKKGETLFSISKLYNMSVEKIKKLNRMIVAKIHPGQKLKLNQSIEESKPKEIAKDEITKNETESKADNTPKVSTHKVIAGESLFTIAKMYNISIDDLKKANNLTSTKIKPNQIIEIVQNQNNEASINVPTEIKSGKKLSENNDEAPAKTITHKVKKGESLIEIAKNNNLTVDELKRINNLSDSKIRFGQKLKLSDSNGTQKSTPTKTENTPKLIHHQVKSGESFYTIAKIYGCKMSELKEWNKKTGNKIKVGEKIIVYQKVD